MDANVVDTLRFADRLKEAGFDPPKADGLARALGEELGDRVLTRIDHDALVMRIDGLEAKFDAKFEAMEAKFEAMEAKFDAKFEAMEVKFDARFEGLEARFEGLEARFEGLEATFVGLEAKFESLHTNLKLLMAVFAIGFTVVIGLGMYNVVA
ncbi:MAG: hypothetical protein OXP36_04445 [Gammaproteobacteria bacterium]|nr:hypothetical protein [Gammaproteobacteria bacterium]